ncbi:hypothetical protein pb186bvf_009671 [Paramecium bursaria]
MIIIIISTFAQLIFYLIFKRKLTYVNQVQVETIVDYINNLYDTNHQIFQNFDLKFCNRLDVYKYYHPIYFVEEIINVTYDQDHLINYNQDKYACLFHKLINYPIINNKEQLQQIHSKTYPKQNQTILIESSVNLINITLLIASTDPLIVMYYQNEESIDLNNTITKFIKLIHHYIPYDTRISQLIQLQIDAESLQIYNVQQYNEKDSIFRNSLKIIHLMVETKYHRMRNIINKLCLKLEKTKFKNVFTEEIDIQLLKDLQDTPIENLYQFQYFKYKN